MPKWVKVVKERDHVWLENGEEFVVGSLVKAGSGTLRLQVNRNGKLSIVRHDKSGKFVYCLNLTRDSGYRLGPKYGHRIVLPSEETDPFKRVLRILGVAVTKLTFAEDGQVLPFSTRTRDLRMADIGTSDNNWLTDGTKTVAARNERTEEGSLVTCVTGEIKNATYAIETVSIVHFDYQIGTYVEKVVIWPTCNLEQVSNILAQIVFGQEADDEYLEALEDFETAKRWISERYSISPYPDNENCVLIDGDLFGFDEEYREPQIVDRLVRRHGVNVLRSIVKIRRENKPPQREQRHSIWNRLNPFGGGCQREESLRIGN